MLNDTKYMEQKKKLLDEIMSKHGEGYRSSETTITVSAVCKAYLKMLVKAQRESGEWPNTQKSIVEYLVSEEYKGLFNENEKEKD